MTLPTDVGSANLPIYRHFASVSAAVAMVEDAAEEVAECLGC